MQHTSRAKVFAGLVPHSNVVMFVREDPEGSPSFQYHGLTCHFMADHLNTASANIYIQDSADGVTWTTRWAGTIVPGGNLEGSAYLRQAWARVLLNSDGSGRIDATVNVPEDQINPGLWSDVGFDSEYA